MPYLDETSKIYLENRLEELLDEIDELDPIWRWQLPDCKHIFCYWNIHIAYKLDTLNAYLSLLDEPDIWDSFLKGMTRCKSHIVHKRGVTLKSLFKMAWAVAGVHLYNQ